MRIQTFRLVTLIAIFTITIIFTSCYAGYEGSKYRYKVSHDEAGNRVFTLNKGIGHFSFVCPPQFEAGHIDIDNDYDYTNADLLGPTTEDGTWSFISIFVTEIQDNTRDAESYGKERLEGATDFVNFTLINESNLTVAGVQAYHNGFSYDTVSDPHNPRSPVYTRIERRVYFNHDNLFLRISLHTLPSKIEQDFKAFDLVLETFKVLN